MDRIVLKFGGTTLESKDRIKKAAEHVKKTMDSGYFPVIVVSAMGRKGAPYATDTLIKKAEEINTEIPPREKDLLMSCGEVISSVIMAQALRALGLKAISLTGAQAGIITDNNFGEPEILNVNPLNIIKAVEKNQVPVITGFQGVSSEGQVTTLGRGGSDISACIIAASVDADFVEICTDVDGIMTADPSIIKNAKVLDRASYTEVCELAHQGAGVIHPAAAEVAMENEIPLEIKSILDDRKGTHIEKRIKRFRPVTGITSKEDIILVRITLPDKNGIKEELDIFTQLAEHGISVDFINIQPESINFIVNDSKEKELTEILNNEKIDFSTHEDFVKVTVVGEGMTGRPGVMSRVVESLKNEKIPIYQSTDSHTSIACLVRKEHKKRAIEALHEAFNLNE